MASHTVANAFRTMREDAPTATTIILAALKTQETTLLNWLVAEDDSSLPEWRTTYDLWQGTRAILTQFGGTPTP